MYWIFRLKNGVVRAMAIRIFNGGVCHVEMGLVSHGFKSIVIGGENWDVGTSWNIGASWNVGAERYNRYGNWSGWNSSCGSIGNCSITCDRCKGWSKGFQKETELLFGGERDGSRCGVAGQEAGSNEAVVGVIEGVNNDDFGDSGR